MEKMSFLKRFWGHSLTINKHRLEVMRLCFKCGLIKQGLMHDLSKYSFIEFFSGVKYYQGYRSPIDAEKEDKGYSLGWLHHKGRNKHHSEYWIDLTANEKTPIMPYKYVAEMLCDKMAAGMIYQGKNWNKEYQLEYWKKEREQTLINEKIEKIITEFLTQVSIDGLDKALTRKNLKYLYKKYCGNS